MKISKQKHCIVIGAGIGGMATAVRLAAIGHNVTVLEKNNLPGGKIGQIQRAGFRFDTGPSLFTLPQMVNELLQNDIQNQDKGVKYKKLETVCKYFYEDGTRINAYENPVDFADEIEHQTGEPAQSVLRYLEISRKRYEASADLFIFNPVKRMFRILRQTDWKKFKPLLHINPLQTMHSENSHSFRSPHVVQLFDRYATYNGSSPYLASSVLNVISHLEHNTGAFFPEKGMYSIVENIYQKALELGVKFRFGSEVTGLLRDKNSISGVKTRKEEFFGDAVISDLDINTFYQGVASELKSPFSVKKPDLSSSALIFYWGMGREFPDTDVHNILFSAHYREEFAALFEQGELFRDPTVYLFISSKIVKADAPAGCENWFVMINVPAISKDNQELLKDQARKIIIEKIKRVLKIDPTPHILFEEVTTPRTLQDVTGSYKGALYGNNSNSIRSAFLRHSNHSKKYKNLYFTGGTVHPGGGIPLCLASAAIVAKEIERS